MEFNTTTCSSSVSTKAVEDVALVAYGLVAPAIILVGIVGNILNLVVLTRPLLRGVMYIYLTALATCNLCALIVAITMVMDFLNLYNGNYFSTIYRAHIELPLLNGFSASSVFLIVAMTVDRYVSVARPTKFSKMHTRWRANITIILILIAGFLLNFPLVFYRQVVECADDATYGIAENTNVTSRPYWVVYLYISETCMRFGPLFVLIILNILIFYKFRKIEERRQRLKAGYVTPTPPSTDDRKITSEVSKNNSLTVSSMSSYIIARFGTLKRVHSPEERRLIHVLIGITILFVLCTAPAAILSIISADNLQDDTDYQLFRAVANDLEMLNFAANFYVYCLCSKEIREAFLFVIKCRRVI